MKNSHNNLSFFRSAPTFPSLRTDLACESINASGGAPGTSYREYSFSSIPISELTVMEGRGEAATGRKAGRYITLHTGAMRYIDEDRKSELSEAIANVISTLTESITKKSITQSTKVLVAGLGNRFISADSVGPRTADKIAVTSHMLESSHGDIFRLLGCSSISAVHPGVMGQTGIEAAAMIKGACDYVKPDVVIAVDALAARSTKRLCATVQLSDTGIEPGSGIGNRRGAVNSTTIGFPVIALGVPTVVDSATLVFDALIGAGITKLDPSLEEALNGEENFFVSPKDSDIVCEEISAVLASAINKAFLADGL